MQLTLAKLPSWTDGPSPSNSHQDFAVWLFNPVCWSKAAEFPTERRGELVLAAGRGQSRTLVHVHHQLMVGNHLLILCTSPSEPPARLQPTALTCPAPELKSPNVSPVPHFPLLCPAALVLCPSSFFILGHHPHLHQAPLSHPAPEA